jgi:ribosomal protein S18 acetylase RimI-like enzyme
MNSAEIIAVTLNDLSVLQKIGIETFYESFSSVNTEENMTQYLAEAYSLEKLTDEFNNPNSSFYFAVVNDKIIGYLKINFGDSQTELKQDNALEIERIYVLQEFHGKKIGQLLFEKAMELAIQKKADYVWLGVWEENPRAISFYKKNGFVEFDKHIFRLGDDDQTDIMMKLQLKTN